MIHPLDLPTSDARAMTAAEWLKQAQQYEQAQAWADAADAYEQALVLEPANAQIHNDAGVVYELLSRLDQAEQHYRAALQCDAPLIYGHYNLGKLLKSQGRADEAQIELEAFLSCTRDPAEIAESKTLLKEISGQSYEKCAGCGSLSTLVSFFKPSRGGKLCPRCYAQLRFKNPVATLLTGLWLLLSVACLLCAYPVAVYYGLANLALVVALSYPLIVPHELAHAGIAWLTGGKVFEIRIGNGQIMWERPIGDVIVSLSRYPTSGFCASAFPTCRFIRARWLLAISAGMLFNAVMLLIFVPGADPDNWIFTYAWREVFVAVNGIHLLTSLWPQKVNVGGLEAITDGGLVWQIITGKLSADALHLFYFVNGGVHALRRKMFSRAVEVCEAGLTLYPDSTLLKNTLAIALLELERPAEASMLFRELLERFLAQPAAREPGITEDNRTLVKTMLLNNVAYATMLASPGQEELRQACNYARQAFRMAPWMAHVQGTWGSVLVESGAVKEGVDQLLEAEKFTDIPKSRAEVLAHAAAGCWRLGDQARATELLRKATALDASAYMVRRVQAEMQKGLHGSSFPATM